MVHKNSVYLTPSDSSIIPYNTIGIKDIFNIFQFNLLNSELRTPIAKKGMENFANSPIHICAKYLIINTVVAKNNHAIHSFFV